MRFSLLLLSLLMIGGVVSCKKDKTNPSSGLTAITLAEDATSLNVGDTQSIAFTLTPSNFDKTQLVWHSSDNSILSVDNTGVITGIKEGAAVVTVTNQSATITSVCLVNVLPQLKAIALTKDTLIMHAGDVRNVGFTVNPANSGTNTLVWQSSDITILQVNSSGAVTAKSPGEAIVSVTSQDGLLNKSCLITVLPALDPLAAGLIAYYPFNNSGRDLTGYGNDGTVYNITSVPDRNGNLNSAYHFDGTSSYIAVADNTALRFGLSDFTISTWVNLDSYNTSFVSAIVSKRLAGVNNGWLFAINGSQNTTPLGTVYFGPGGGNADAIGTKVLTPGQWYMVTCVYVRLSYQLSIYVNGVLDQTINGIFPANPNTNANML